MGRLVRGTDLTDSLRREVLSRYVNRHHDTTSKTDSDWLAKKAFYVTKDGRLDNRYHHCEPAFMAD
jgi:hypothetical protein